jgi:D-lactate dehydrogenase (cytochrome)
VETKRDLAATALFAPLVGHAGDGNFHLNIIIDPADAAEYEAAKALNARLVRRALALGGTCTGEHGIGMGKKQYLIEEHGEDAVDVMRTLKRALDPKNLMNPGKIV